MQSTVTPHEAADATADEATFGVFDALLIVAKHWKLLVLLPLCAGIAAVVLSLTMPNIYTANTRIVPPQQGQSSAITSLGGLGALAGALGGGGLGLKNPNDFYIGLLQSRTVADSLIKRFDLRTLYHASTEMDTRAALAGATRIGAGRDGLITIEVDDKDPQRAATLANAYVEELYKLTQTLAVTEASQRRLFFEKQLQNTKNQLAEAEVAMRKTQEATGLIKLDDQGKAIIESAARLQAQIATKEVQLSAMRAFATEQNAEYMLAQRELEGLRTQLSKLERNQQLGGGNILVPTGRIPEAGLEYVRKFRNVRYYETIFELLAKQYEIAKVDEAKDASLIQVLDRATPPERKSKPKRSVIVIFTVLISFFAAVIAAFAIEAVRAMRRHDGFRANVRQLRELILGRRA